MREVYLPLEFDVVADPAESTPLDSDLYRDASTKSMNAVSVHKIANCKPCLKEMNSFLVRTKRNIVARGEGPTLLNCILSIMKLRTLDFLFNQLNFYECSI